MAISLVFPPCAVNFHEPYYIQESEVLARFYFLCLLLAPGRVLLKCHFKLSFGDQSAERIINIYGGI